jgi:Peptidase C13 family
MSNFHNARNLVLSWIGFFNSVRLKPAALNRFKSDLPNAIVITALLLAVVISIDWLMLKRNGAGLLRFNARSLESEALQIGAFLLCSALAGYFANRQSGQSGQSGQNFQVKTFVSGLLIFIALTGAKLLSILIEIAFNFVQWPWLHAIENGYLHLILALWLYLFVFVNLRVGLKLTAAHAAFAMLPLLALQAFQNRVAPTDFWREIKVAKETINPASEDILDKQASLIAAQLGGIAPQREGIKDVYVVGFAPFASEDVFKLELDAIMPMMEKRFDAKGRTQRLSNHLSTLQNYPFASAANLRKTLFAIAAKMNIEEDVLVLYITSHGSKQYTIASRMPPIEFVEINPQNLRAMLDATSIKNRVLIVSACYSGGFIEPLKEANTLVMTAAAANKPSFGCGTESDFTYFGKAVMDEQLRSKTLSFEQAFKNAQPVIREREKIQGFDSSEPQIAVGEKIAPLLNTLAQELESRSAAVGQ